MQLDRAWKPRLEGDFKDITSTDNRRLIMDTTKVAKSNLVNYLKEFYEKQILIKNDNGGSEVNPFFMTEPEGGRVEVNLILDCYED
jgi:hypothetical protein